MAVQGKQGPVTAPVKTPAPDQISDVRHPTGHGYGMNGPQPSSVAPGQAVQSTLATNLRSSVDDSVLDEIIGRGTASGKVDNTQVRSVGTANVPAARGMHDPNSGNAQVPSRLGQNEAPLPTGITVRASQNK